MDVDGFDYREIDDVIHGRVRLAVRAYLSSALSADFNELKVKIGGADGNLSVHLRKLEDPGYITVNKSYRNRKPRTICQLTERGREAWTAYIERLQTLLAAHQ